jgi:hypothetical protein
MVHQDVAHQSRHRQELGPVLPVHMGLIHQLQVRLVHQSGGLQGVALALHPHVMAGDTPQLPFHLRQ